MSGHETQRTNVPRRREASPHPVRLPGPDSRPTQVPGGAPPKVPGEAAFRRLPDALQPGHDGSS